MRISLNEIKDIEDLYFKQGELSKRLLTEAQLIANPQLQEQAHWQAEVYDLVQAYGREKLLIEVKRIEKEMFTQSHHRSFQQLIRTIFKG